MFRSRKEHKSFMEFYKDYSFFLKEGIVTSTEKLEKEEIGKLLRYVLLVIYLANPLQEYVRLSFIVNSYLLSKRV